MEGIAWVQSLDFRAACLDACSVPGVEKWRRPCFSSFTQQNSEAKDTAMTYSSRLGLLLTTLLDAKIPSPGERNSGVDTAVPLQDQLQSAFQQVLDAVQQFRF